MQLKIELAVVVDAGEPSTYILEGDGPLAFQAYEIQKLYAVIASKHFPITLVVAQQLSSVNSTQAAQHANTQQLLTYATACVEPGFTYFMDKFNGDLCLQVNCFKAARMFSPVKMSEMQVVSSNVDELASFPFLNNPNILSELKTELPDYLAAVQASCCTEDAPSLPFLFPSLTETPPKIKEKGKGSSEYKLLQDAKNLQIYLMI